jgi:hypothetical protein
LWRWGFFRGLSLVCKIRRKRAPVALKTSPSSVISVFSRQRGNWMGWPLRSVDRSPIRRRSNWPSCAARTRACRTVWSGRSSLLISKKSGADVWEDVGDSRSGRSELIASTEQLAERVGVSAACQALAMPRSSLYRTRKITEPAAAPTAVVSPRALPPIEKAEVRQVLNSERSVSC